MRRALIGLGIGASAAGLAWLLSLANLATRIEAVSYDFRLRQSAPGTPADTPIAVVEINESSIRELQSSFGRWPWPRVAHAALIDLLAQAGAKVIAYDVLFTERDTRGEFDLAGRRFSGGNSDDALVGAARAAGNVILLAEATYDGLVDQTTGANRACNAPALPGTIYAPGPGFRDRPCLTLPFDALLGAAGAVGHNFTAVTSQSQRRMDPFIVTHDTAVPALGLAAALFALDATPDDVTFDRARGILTIVDRQLPVEEVAVPASGPADTPRRALQSLLWFRAPAPAADDVPTTYPSYSFFDVLLSGDQIATGQTPAIDLSVFKDKIVFVGTMAPGLFDTVQTPFDTDGIGGVHLHATLADNVLSGHTMRRARRATDVALTVAVGLGVGLVATLVPVAWATPAVLAVMAMLAWALTAAVGAGVWVAAVPPMAASALALFGGVAWQYFVEGRAKREVRQLFGRFVSNDVIAQLEADPARATLGGHRRQMSVLFSDMRGFTTATEKGQPEEVVLQLNEYFTAMVEVLFRHQGTLDKFVGDMVMGLFGAPLDDARHADHAVAAARDMVEELGRLNARWVAQGKPTVDIGIGINTGEMIAGNIGSEAIMSYTVIGDAVNLASRLESLNKQYGTRILISEATRSALTTPVETRLIGDVVVKGKSHPVVVHEVLGGSS